MKKTAVFWTNVFIAAYSRIWAIFISIVLMIVGAIWFKICFYIGLSLLVLTVVGVLLHAFYMQRLMYRVSDDNPDFNAIMEKLSSDPQAFLAAAIEKQEENRNLHGRELLTLSDDDLFEAVYFQIIAIAEEAEDEDAELAQFAGARRTVYILSLLDAEIQNGGLCQFFVNSSRMVAPYVSQALAQVGADAHRQLFDGFVAQNNIDVSDLSSFECSSARGYQKQTKRFDFESFDNAYYELPPLQAFVVTYIKNNIDEF